jgi:hypothetical protein
MSSTSVPFLRAARGPVLLITLGALLAMHQQTPYHFGQTFPVLIIVFGLMKLLERVMPADDATPPGPPLGGAQ